MVLETLRFGDLEIAPDDVLQFPQGLIGLESLCQWALLADSGNPSLGWLQSMDRPEVALAVVSPWRFVPGYQLRLPATELAPLALARPEDAQVLAILSRQPSAVTLNLKAPLALNLPRRLGRQVIASGDAQLQYAVAVRPPVELRKSA